MFKMLIVTMSIFANTHTAAMIVDTPPYATLEECNNAVKSTRNAKEDGYRVDSKGFVYAAEVSKYNRLELRCVNLGKNF